VGTRPGSYAQAFVQFRADQARSCAYKLRNSGEGDEGYGAKRVHLTTHDGKVNIWIENGDDSWSVNQVEQLANLLPDVLARARAYTPKPWMLDQTELRRMKQIAYGSCPVVLPEDSVSD